MLGYLVEVLPIMVTLKWVSTLSQPIAISDFLDYLVKAIDSPRPLAGILQIGRPDVASYDDMMFYAREAGLARRRLIRIPFLSPRLSSHWVGLFTTSARFARVALGRQSRERSGETRPTHYRDIRATQTITARGHPSRTRDDPAPRDGDVVYERRPPTLPYVRHRSIVVGCHRVARRTHWA